MLLGRGRSRDGEPVASINGREQPDTLDVLGADYGEPTTHRSRRGWKRPLLAAAVVFVIAMLCITGFELAAGHDLSGNARTTIGSVVGGGGDTRHTPSPTDPATQTPGGSGGGKPSGSPDPSASPSNGDGTPQQGGVSQRQNDHRDPQSPGTPTPSGQQQVPDPTPSAGGGTQDPSVPPSPTRTPAPSVSGGAGAGGQSVQGGTRDDVTGNAGTGE